MNTGGKSLVKTVPVIQTLMLSQSKHYFNGTFLCGILSHLHYNSVMVYADGKIEVGHNGLVFRV